jgi:hypothetical protein
VAEAGEPGAVGAPDALDGRSGLGGHNGLDGLDGLGGGQPAEAPPAPAAEAPARVRRLRPAEGRTSGRERHEEKITVYVSQDELVALEQARLVLRAEHGIAIDRGRLVREAVAEMLVDLETAGEDSVVVSRLRPPP